MVTVHICEEKKFVTAPRKFVTAPREKPRHATMPTVQKTQLWHGATHVADTDLVADMPGTWTTLSPPVGARFAPACPRKAALQLSVIRYR